MNTKINHVTKGELESLFIVQEDNDPLTQKNIMMRKSMKKRLKMKSFLDEVSESEIIRQALEKYL